MLTGSGGPPPPTALPNSRRDAIPWYFKPAMLFVAFLVVGPLMLPLLWVNPHLDRRSKLVWTITISLVSFILIWATMKAISTLVEYYKMIGF